MNRNLLIASIAMFIVSGIGGWLFFQNFRYLIFPLKPQDVQAISENPPYKPYQALPLYARVAINYESVLIGFYKVEGEAYLGYSLGSGSALLLRVNEDEFLDSRHKQKKDTKLTLVGNINLLRTMTHHRLTVNGRTVDESHVKSSRPDFFAENKHVLIFDSLEKAPPVSFYILSGLTIVPVIIGIIGIILFFRRRSNPSLHPLMKLLGSMGPLDDVLNSLNREALDESAVRKVGSFFMTRNYLFIESFLSLNLLAFHDVVWIYETVTHHSTNGVPTGTSYTLNIFDRHGKQLSFKMGKGNGAEVIDFVVQAAPHVFTGYSDRVQSMWNNNRQELINYVDSAKQRDF